MTTSTSSLPALIEDYPLTGAQIDGFRRDGHVLLRSLVAPDELAPYRAVIGAAVEAHRAERRPLEERDFVGKAFIQVVNLWERDAGTRAFVTAPRFTRVACRLFGVPAVRLFYDQALFKEPGGTYTPAPGFGAHAFSRHARRREHVDPARRRPGRFAAGLRTLEG